MKNLLTLIALTLSVSTFAQVEKVINSDDLIVDAPAAKLIRVAGSPEKIEVQFRNIPTHNTEGIYETREVSYPCTVPGPLRTEMRRVCTSPVGSTRQICRTEAVRVPTYVRSICRRYDTVRVGTRDLFGTTSDKVKIKFKDLPRLGGSEQEVFEVVASQNGTDSSNIVYTITPVKTLNDRAYDVKKKGILGVDSFVIEPK